MAQRKGLEGLKQELLYKSGGGGLILFDFLHYFKTFQSLPRKQWWPSLLSSLASMSMSPRGGGGGSGCRLMIEVPERRLQGMKVAPFSNFSCIICSSLSPTSLVATRCSRRSHTHVLDRGQSSRLSPFQPLSLPLRTIPSNPWVDSFIGINPASCFHRLSSPLYQRFFAKGKIKIFDVHLEN